MLPQKRHRADDERDRRRDSSHYRDPSGEDRHRSRSPGRSRPRHRSRSRDRSRRDHDRRGSHHREPTKRPPIDVEEGEIATPLNYDDSSAPTTAGERHRSPQRPAERDPHRAEMSTRQPPTGPRSERRRDDDRRHGASHHRHRSDDRRGHNDRPEARDQPAPVAPLPTDTAPPPPAKPVEPEPEMELDLPETQPERDPAAILEERRRARAAILAKYSAGATAPGTPAAQDSRETTPAFGDGVSALNSPAQRLDVNSPRPASEVGQPSAAVSRSPSPSPDADEIFALEKDAEETAAERVAGEVGRSAADYNPNDDRLQDERRQLEREGHVAGATGFGKAALAEAEADDEDDMFAMVDRTILAAERAPEAHDGLPEAPVAAADDPEPAVLPVIDRSAGGQTDSFDDGDGYYRVILGELLDNGRYHVVVNLGKGMFSSVVRARDNEAAESDPARTVAIKIVRSQETMYKAGQKEAIILNRLREADPQDKKHVVRLYRTFEHRGHLCLVFENLNLNLREVVKRFGKDVGINLRAVRAYAHQMFLSLSLMRKLDIIHADIKPDNILVNESKSQLKMCDLGSASDTSDNAITPYLVSRFYRAPEIIIGLPYDCAIDMWSIGCTLYELYTGKILFAGRNNNQMLLEVQELRGRLPNKMLKKARFAEAHFDEAGLFISQERNKLTGQETVKKVNLPPKPASDLRSRLMQPAQTKRLPEDDLRLLQSFVDLLNRSLELDPSKRITPKEALMHPFLR